MKRKIYVLIGLCMSCLIYFSCQEERELLPSDREEVTKRIAFSISEAKTFFENNAEELSPMRIPDTFPVTRGRLKSNLELIPVWEQAMSSGHSEVELIEIPLNSNTLTYARERKYEDGKIVWRKNTLFARRLLIAKKKDGSIDMFIITIIPDGQVRGDLFKRIEDFRYLTGGGFTGKVLLSTLDGVLLKGFGYTNGHCNGRLQLRSRSQLVKEGFDFTNADMTTYRLKEIMGTKSGSTYVFGENMGGDDLCPHGYSGDDCPICMEEVVITYCQDCQTQNGCVCQYCDHCGNKEMYCDCPLCIVCHLKFWECRCGEYPDPNPNPNPDTDPNPNPNPDPDPGEEGGGQNTNPGKVSYSVTMSVKNIVTLGEPYNFHLSIQPSTNVKNVSYLIGKRGRIEQERWELESSKVLTCMKRAFKPGYWEVRAVVSLTDTVITTSIENVEVQYPDSKLIENKTADYMKNIWQQTKMAASSAGRQEKGCWIYINTATGRYEYGITIDGPMVAGCAGTHGSIPLVPPMEQIPAKTPIEAGKYYIAFFHTHTPLTYCPNTTFRDPGPSETDKEIMKANNIPGFVYDYIGSYDDIKKKVVISGGHDIDASATTYPFGADRCPTPTIY